MNKPELLKTIKRIFDLVEKHDLEVFQGMDLQDQLEDVKYWLEDVTDDRLEEDEE